MIFGFLFGRKNKGGKEAVNKKTKSFPKKKISGKKKIEKVSLKKNPSGKKAVKKQTIKKAGKKQGGAKTIPAKKEKNIQRAGKVTHYFPKVKAAVVKVSKGPIKLEDTLYIKGSTTDFKQKVKSLQIERRPVTKAEKGNLIGIRVNKRTREGDIVFKEF